MGTLRHINSDVQPDEATGLYDVRRLAELLNVKTSTIRSMRRRNQLPQPTSSDINGTAVWAQEIVDDYFQIQDRISKTVSSEINPDLPKVIDLFSGCGGLAMGFQLAGFDVIAGFDNWECAVNTYSANLGHEARLADLGDVEATKELLAPYFPGNGQRPAIIGGPPCQDFSSAGQRKEGARADLTEKFADIVAHFMPPFFVMENVPRAEKANAYNNALDTLRDAGYTVVKRVLDASLCGVPQRRKRLIAIGALGAEFAPAVGETLDERLAQEPMTVRDWFGNDLGVEHYYRHPRSYARRGVFSIDEPSPTIRGVNRPIPSGYPGHPGDTAPVDEARPLTTSERAQIQTFPEGFKFLGSKTESEQMIGNAVPVRLAKYIATAIADNTTPNV